MRFLFFSSCVSASERQSRGHAESVEEHLRLGALGVDWCVCTDHSHPQPLTSTKRLVLLKTPFQGRGAKKRAGRMLGIGLQA